jgi:signal transduction histidine kinase
MFSKRILRLFKKHFGTEDGVGIVEAMKRLAARPDIEPILKQPLENFGDFLQTVQESNQHDDARLKVAMHNLELGLEELNQANLNLEKMNTTSKAMLDGLGQGLFYFDREGLCTPIYSKATLSLMEGDPAGRDIGDVLKLDSDQATSIHSLLGLLFNTSGTALSFDDMIALAPKYYRHTGGLRVMLSYRPMRNSMGTMTGVLVVATDITKEFEAQEKIRSKEMEVLRILRITKNRRNFIDCLHSLRAAFSTMDRVSSTDGLKRDMHTLKGMVKVFYLDVLAEQLHAFETRLRQVSDDGQRLLALCREYRPRFEHELMRAENYGREILGDDFDANGNVISIDAGHLGIFGDYLKQNASADVVTHFYESIVSVPICDLLNFFETQILHFAGMAGHEIDYHYEEPDGIRISPEFYQSFFSSLVHVARNIIDHAFENTGTRRKLGKSEIMAVRVKLSRQQKDGNQSFVLSITDDGQGIDAARLRQKLRLAPDIEDHDVIQHVFDADLSTLDNVTIHSGYGTGLNVVKEETRKLKGSATVESAAGQGTTFTFILPMIHGHVRSL